VVVNLSPATVAPLLRLSCEIPFTIWAAHPRLLHRVCVCRNLAPVTQAIRLFQLLSDKLRCLIHTEQIFKKGLSEARRGSAADIVSDVARAPLSGIESPDCHTGGILCAQSSEYHLIHTPKNVVIRHAEVNW